MIPSAFTKEYTVEGLGGYLLINKDSASFRGNLIANPDGTTTIDLTDYKTPGDRTQVDSGISSGSVRRAGGIMVTNHLTTWQRW